MGLELIEIFINIIFIRTNEKKNCNDVYVHVNRLTESSLSHYHTRDLMTEGERTDTWCLSVESVQCQITSTIN